MIIKVMNREDFEKFESEIPFIAISISDPGSISAESATQPIAKLEMQFTDIDKFINRKTCKLCNGTGKSKLFANDTDCICMNGDGIVLFDEKMAKHILFFVESFKLDTNMIVVHCEAGISRSAGVAAALSLILNKTDQYYFDHYCPNMLVYRKILNEYFKEQK